MRLGVLYELVENLFFVRKLCSLRYSPGRSLLFRRTLCRRLKKSCWLIWKKKHYLRNYNTYAYRYCALSEFYILIRFWHETKTTNVTTRLGSKNIVIRNNIHYTHKYRRCFHKVNIGLSSYGQTKSYDSRVVKINYNFVIILRCMYRCMY